MSSIPDRENVRLNPVAASCKREATAETVLYIGKVIVYARGLLLRCRSRKALRFLVEAIIHPVHYAEWFDYLESGLPKGMRSDTVGHLIEHTARRYLRRWFRYPEKMGILRCHYDMLGARFPLRALELLGKYPGVVVAELSGKTGRRYQITLQQSMLKEGEIAFRFFDVQEGTALATFRGTFGPGTDGRKVFWIGAVQGPYSLPGREAMGREAIAIATRDLDILRPKHAVLHALVACCTWMKVDTIYAPPHENHVGYHWWRPLLTQHKILNDYEGFWKEFTAERTPRGDACISLPLTRRKLAEVQSKRRRDWLRRYARVDALTESVAASLDALERIEK